MREMHLSANGGTAPRPRPTGTQEMPAGLNWNLWLGPAAERPYHAQWMAWGQWREFANGYMGMWGSHSYPAVFKGLPADKFTDVGEPRRSLPRPLGQSTLTRPTRQSLVSTAPDGRCRSRFVVS